MLAIGKVSKGRRAKLSPGAACSPQSTRAINEEMAWRRTGPRSVRVDNGKACRIDNIGDGWWRAGQRRSGLVTLEHNT
jgi:hypothetical protein